MNDKEKISRLYSDMYAAMVNKNRSELERVHAPSFYLLHMTGMKQSRETYIESIMNGTLNYYSEQTEELDIETDGGSAVLTGKSRVTAAVFGGGKNPWRLKLTFTLEKSDDEWRFISAKASTY